MMDNNILLNCQEVSQIEELIYSIEDFSEDLKDKTQEELKEVFDSEYGSKYIFATYWTVSRLYDLLPLLKNIILNKYYEEDMVNIKIDLQKKKCDEWKFPYFAPDDGKCFNCNKQIYEHLSLKEVLEEPITHCPYCSRAYND